jgi:hypothetical protein
LEFTLGISYHPVARIRQGIPNDFERQSRNTLVDYHLTFDADHEVGPPGKCLFDES